MVNITGMEVRVLCASCCIMCSAGEVYAITVDVMKLGVTKSIDNGCCCIRIVNDCIFFLLELNEQESNVIFTMTSICISDVLSARNLVKC